MSRYNCHIFSENFIHKYLDQAESLYQTLIYFAEFRELEISDECRRWGKCLKLGLNNTLNFTLYDLNFIDRDLNRAVALTITNNLDTFSYLMRDNSDYVILKLIELKGVIESDISAILPSLLVHKFNELVTSLIAQNAESINSQIPSNLFPKPLF